MNRNQFLRKLARLLKKLPQEEKEAALRYYREYLDEAGAENERRALEELGSPEKVAAEILSGSSRPDSAAVPRAAKGGIGVVWTAILSILAAPVALPLAIAAICIVLAVAVVVLALLLAFIAGAVASAAAGIMLMCAFPAFFFSSFGMGCLSIGAFLFIFAVFILLLALTVWLSQLIFQGFARLFSKSGRKTQNEQNS